MSYNYLKQPDKDSRVKDIQGPKVIFLWWQPKNTQMVSIVRSSTFPEFFPLFKSNVCLRC